MLKLYVLSTLLPFAFANCNDLKGCWVNEKNSVLQIDPRGYVVGGRFKTAVESAPGAGGKDSLPITGWINDTMISFTVLFPQSTVGFVGQCYESKTVRGLRTVIVQDVMETMWLLLSRQESIEKHWMSTRVGNDRFTRTKECQFEEDNDNSLS